MATDDEYNDRKVFLFMPWVIDKYTSRQQHLTSAKATALPYIYV